MKGMGSMPIPFILFLFKRHSVETERDYCAPSTTVPRWLMPATVS